MVRHSHEDALDEASFQTLVDTAQQLPSPYDAECSAVLMLGGRLGLRGGEIAHLRSRWVDRGRSVIEIPRRSECRTGKDGGICGYCKKRARQAADAAGTPLEQELQERWQPKTEKGARAVPYDFDAMVEAVIEAFVEKYDCWPTSRVGVNRRVDRVAKAAGYDDRLYPHALRATAATFHASRGVPSAVLQSLMGWAQLSVAEKYVRITGEAASRALQDAHSD